MHFFSVNMNAGRTYNKGHQKLCKGAETVCDMEIQFDSTGGDKLVTDEKKINAWIDKVKSYIG